MTVEATVAVAAGIAAGSVALMAFGIDSVIEFVAGFLVLREFRAEHGGSHGSETRAIRVIGLTFFLLAIYIVAEATYILVTASKPANSLAGIALAGAALVVMPLLAGFKRRTGMALDSRMLLADSAESLLCAYLAATVLVGLVLNLAFGWWWADPAAALIIVPLVVREGLEALSEDDSE